MSSPRTSSQLKDAAYACYHQGKLKKARSLFRQASKLDKMDTEVWLSLGVINQEMSLFSEAESCFRKLLWIQPDHAEAYCYLGILLDKLKQPQKAIASLNKAIKINPDEPWFHFNLANLHEASGNNDDAVRHYKQAILLDANYAQAYINLGLVLVALGKLEQAIENYEKGITLMPDEPATHNNLGLALSKLGKYDRAITCFQTAIRLKPDLPEIHNNLGITFLSQCRAKEAISSIQHALQLDPDYAEAYLNLGNAFLTIGDREQAIEYYLHTLQLTPGNEKAYINKGTALLELGRLEEARGNFQQAMDINPNHTGAINNMGSLMMELGLAEKALEYFLISLEVNPEQPDVKSNVLLSLNYLPEYSEQTIFDLHIQHMSGNNSRLVKQKHTNRLRTKQPLRIGYISADLHRHPVAQFIEPVLTNHDLSMFEIHCYADVKSPDETTWRLQSLVKNWHNIRGLADSEVAGMIRNDAIDILIDLAGHTGENRLGVFSQKPAPVQISYLGYANTTGLQCMDYRITDIHVDPEGKTDRLHSEKLLRLPDSFCCYKPLTGSPETATPPVMSNGFITFASFNNLVKINPDVISLWSHILNQVKNSRLLLKTGGLHEKQPRQRIEEEFYQHGVSPDRLILEGKDDRYLERYNQVDIGLDPFPWNGGTTSFDMVWMSVPFITLAGNSYRSRMGLAILENLELTNMIANSHDEYVSKAVALASNIPLLQQLRAELRERFRKSPLMNAQRFTSQLESAYRYAWQQSNP